MEKILILISGIPGAGKTRFANYLSEKLKIALICKDSIKEILWDSIHYSTADRDEAKIYGAASYDLSFYFCETIMKTGQPVIFESNFTNLCQELIHSTVQRYGYKAVNVQFGGDINVIHKRFLERDESRERHPGLVSNGFYSSVDLFEKAVQPCVDFKYGDVLINVDATDFSNIIYDDLVKEILARGCISNRVNDNNLHRE